ncbi:PemK family transcriptional regulator [Candidatus Poribacteria bacterium]|nr:MAG: PemK family transcriptional regulator [Candidatus Poribacteria bacterium]
MSPKIPNPRRGEVWDINFDPTIGTEIKKTRPAVVLNINSIRHLKIRLVAPITSWNNQYSNKIWVVEIKPDAANGLSHVSGVDTMQMKGVDTTRFLNKRGRLKATDMDEINAAIVAIIDFV